MHNMVLDLLDTASLDAGRLALDKGLWPAESLLEEAVDMLAPQADDRRVTLTSALDDRSLLIDCDRQRTLRVFSNLIGNALKFTPEHGYVRVSATAEGENVTLLRRGFGTGYSGLNTAAESSPATGRPRAICAAVAASVSTSPRASSKRTADASGSSVVRPAARASASRYLRRG